MDLKQRFKRFVDFTWDNKATRDKVYNKMVKNLEGVNFTNPNPDDFEIGIHTTLSGSIHDIRWFMLMLETVGKKELEMEEVQKEKAKQQAFIDEMMEE